MQSGQRKIVEEKVVNTQQVERWLETIKHPSEIVMEILPGRWGLP